MKKVNKVVQGMQIVFWIKKESESVGNKWSTLDKGENL